MSAVLSEASPIDRLLSPQMVAEVLSVNRPFVYGLISSGALISVKLSGKVRRIRQSDLTTWINSH